MYVHAPTDSYYDENILTASTTCTNIIYKEYALAKKIKIFHLRGFINNIFLGFLPAKSGNKLEIPFRK